MQKPTAQTLLDLLAQKDDIQCLNSWPTD